LRRRTSSDAPSRSSVSGAPAADAAVSNRRSIVVLPFANLSSDPENEYFSDGLTEEIIADLSKVKALRVISRTSAMQLKGAKKDVRTIGRDLDVRYILEGGVRKAGNSLRITAQLIDAQTDAHVWSEKYRGTLDDVFEVQERVSREIVRALDVTLTSNEDRLLAERPIANARAFELYLQARQEIRRIREDALERASGLLSQAVAIEGETPPADGPHGLGQGDPGQGRHQPRLAPPRRGGSPGARPPRSRSGFGRRVRAPRIHRVRAW
jgi:TolB-like protein